MSDKVNAAVEDMFEELDYYKRNEFFSEDEIRDIVKQRKQFEYDMYSSGTTVQDYLKAIVYEKKLNVDFLHRRQQKTKRVLKMIDFSIKRRIIGLYERMTRRFRNDISLIKEYVKYLLSTRSLNKFNSVISRILHIYPNILDFWLIAVYCEFDLRGSMQAARKIMQQGIRRNSDNPDFYFEYMKFELRVLQKIHKRKVVLETSENIEVIEETKEEQKQPKKQSESVPTIIYTVGESSLVKKFRLDVRLHFKIKELVNSFSDIIDVQNLLNTVDQHINEVIYTE